ncbi:3679_t:CDS:2, partial [Gigaspora rosea]
LPPILIVDEASLFSQLSHSEGENTSQISSYLDENLLKELSTTENIIKYKERELLVILSRAPPKRRRSPLLTHSELQL